MNKLILALFAGAFTLGSTAVLADDSDLKPLTRDQTKMYQQQRAEAKAALEKMTPEQRAALRKATATKKQYELSALEQAAQEGYDDTGARKEAKAAVAQSKAMPAPTKEQRAADLKSLEKTQQESGMPAAPPKK